MIEARNAELRSALLHADPTLERAPPVATGRCLLLRVIEVAQIHRPASTCCAVCTQREVAARYVTAIKAHRERASYAIVEAHSGEGEGAIATLTRRLERASVQRPVKYSATGTGHIYRVSLAGKLHITDRCSGTLSGWMSVDDCRCQTHHIVARFERIAGRRWS